MGGFLVQKMEVGGAGAFEKCDTMEAVVDELLHYSFNSYRAVADADRQGLIALFKRHMQEVDDFIASIKARPINGVSQRLQDGQDRIYL